jgi:hypothetical protein
LDSKAVALDRKRLEELKVFLGEKAGIVAKIPYAKTSGRHLLYE